MTGRTRPDEYPVHRRVTTRWADNDMFGHLNNAVYLELFDTAINGWLAEATARGPLDQPARGVVAESSLRFLAEVGFPSPVSVGLAVERLGTKSITYTLALFVLPESAGGGAAPDDAVPDDAVLAATGRWVHVYVDPQTRATVPIPPEIRAAVEAIA